MFILDVFYEILKKEPTAILLLGGVDAGQLSECVAKTKEMKIEKHVRFIGIRSDVADVLKAIDVYLFPSLYEGLGIVLLEAQASGCYCVASTACPTDSDIGLGLIDYIPLAKTAQEWTKIALKQYQESIVRYISDDDVRCAFAKKEYSIEQLAKKMTNIYTEEKSAN